jgi:hypothetical protein
LIYRHTALVRATHWINVVLLTILLMSGLQIFNAHPALYWGEVSNFGDPALSITAQRTDGGASRGITTVAGHQFDTTGWLGLSRDATGRSAARAFPAWATLPSWQSLAEGRLWHFFFAWLFVLNGLVYLLFGPLNLHLWRDMVPSRQELRGMGAPHGITCGCASRPGRKQPGTMSSRSCPIWSWCSSSCPYWCLLAWRCRRASMLRRPNC